MKELTEFSRDAKASDGRQSVCKACHAATGYERLKRWRERHPTRYREINAKHNTLRRGAVLAGERVAPERVWERDEGMCGICGAAADPEDWHLDHVIPISRGGEHSYRNVQVCNVRKRDHLTVAP